VYTPLTLNKQIGIINNLIENVKNESQLIMDNNDFTLYGDKLIYDNVEYNKIDNIKKNIQLIIDNEKKNLEYINSVNNYIHSTEIKNTSLADYMLDRNPKISSNDVINSNITNASINFNNINLDEIKQILMVNKVHMFSDSNDRLQNTKYNTSHIKHIKLKYKNSSTVLVIYDEPIKI